MFVNIKLGIAKQLLGSQMGRSAKSVFRSAAPMWEGLVCPPLHTGPMIGPAEAVILRLGMDHS